jgi:hypothetical protein
MTKEVSYLDDGDVCDDIYLKTAPLAERTKAAKDPTYRDTLIDQRIEKILQQGSAASVDNDFIKDLPEGANVRS